MSEAKRTCGHPVFMFGSNFGPKDCPICPYIRTDREKLAGLVEERLARLHKVQDERDALNKDTIVQDCKIDALETTLAQIRTTPIGDEK